LIFEDGDIKKATRSSAGIHKNEGTYRKALKESRQAESRAFMQLGKTTGKAFEEVVQKASEAFKGREFIT